MPNPALVSGTQNNAAIASGTSATVTSTGSVTAGNLLIVFLLVGGATAPSALTAPDATWTTAMTTIATASGGTIVAGIFTKQVTATGAFSGAFSWTTTATSGHWALTEWSTSQGALVTLDGAVSRTQNASGTNTSPSVTPGGNNTLDTLICCSFGGVVGVDALTIPAGMTAITSMATAGTASIPFFYGASLALASAAATGTKTWTIPTSQTNLGVSLLLQSQPLWGFETQTQLPMRNQLTAAPRARAVRQTPGFAFFGDLGRTSWPLDQPPVPRPGGGLARVRQRIAAITEDREDGNELPVPPLPVGWGIQPPQPLSRLLALRQRAAAITKDRDDGSYLPAPPPLTFTFDQPSQPLRRAPQLRSPDVGDGGIALPFVPPFLNPWFEIAPPALRRPAHATAAVKHRMSLAVSPPWLNWGFEQTASQDLHRWGRSPEIGDAGIVFPFTPPAVVPWFEVSPSTLRRPARTMVALRQRMSLAFPPPWINAGFDQVFSQDLHRFRKSPEFGDQGIVFPFVPPAVAPWFETSPPLVRHALFRSPEPGDAGIASPYVRFTALDWPWLPTYRHPRPERSAAVLRGDEGIVAPTRPVISPWFETTALQPPFYPKISQRGPGLEGQSVFAAFQLSPWWDDRMEQIRVPPTRRGAFLRGDDGNQATFTPPTVLPLTSWPEPPVFPHPRREKSGALMLGDAGIEQIELPWVNLGWDQVTSQPRHPSWRSPDVGDGGIEFPFVFVAPIFTPLFEVAPPPLRRPPRTAAALKGRSEFAIFPPWVNLGFDQAFSQDLHCFRKSPEFGDQGIVFPFVPPAAVPWFETTPALTRHQFWKNPEFGDQGILSPLARFFPPGWEVQPPQPPHPRREKAGSIQFGELGIEAQYVFVPPTQFVGWGFEPIPSPQPPHPRRERAGTLMRGSEIESPFVFVAPPTIGWEIQSWQPPHLRRERMAAIVPREDGIQVPIIFRPYGWEIQPPQPPHPRPERAGTVMRGDEGIAGFIAPPAPPFSWEIQAVQPPRLRFERRGAILRGDDGTQGGFVRFFPSGWEVQPVQPPRRYHERRGLFLRGDEGTQAPFARFFPLLQEPTPPLFFRRPLPRVPVFMLDSVEQFGIFVPPAPPSVVCVRIAPYGAATTIGAMELKTIIEAFKATTIIKRQDCT